MPQPKGKSGNPKGRPLGKPNKSTTAIREALNDILSGELEDLSVTLQQLEPLERVDAIIRLLPFVAPKIVEQSADGGAAQIMQPPNVTFVCQDMSNGLTGFENNSYLQTTIPLENTQ